MDRREEALGLLSDVQMVYVATWDGEFPRVRPMSLVYKNGRFWVCTGSKDAKARQLVSNPAFEFSLLLEGDGCRGTLRGSGRARMVTDPDERRAVAGLVPFFEDYWQEPNDPSFFPVELLVNRLEHMRPGEMHSEVIDL
ncbi:MAG: pyridoxamine 5'-phosphate oxidase family protein [Candidatus Fermentibacteraceae bacterium]